MTTTQIDELTRAEQIARRDHLHAIKGSDGRWAVLNRTATKQHGYPCYHVLSVAGDRILCDCYAAQNGRICAHRAAVRMAIVEERYVERESQLRYEAGWVPAMGPRMTDEDPSATASAWC